MTASPDRDTLPPCPKCDVPPTRGSTGWLYGRDRPVAYTIGCSAMWVCGAPTLQEGTVEQVESAWRSLCANWSKA